MAVDFAQHVRQEHCVGDNIASALFASAGLEGCRGMAARRKDGRPNVRTSWDPVAEWYTGWVGESGSKHHQLLALPAALDLLAPASGERILDIGAGPGVL